MDALENGQQQLDQDGVFAGVSRQAINEVLAHLRSQTPPHAVMREDILKAWNEAESSWAFRDAILALLAEKQAPAAPPLADHLADPAHYAEADKHGLADVELLRTVVHNCMMNAMNGEANNPEAAYQMFKVIENECRAALTNTAPPLTTDIKTCPRCKGTGDEPAYTNPNHYFACNLCDGAKFVRVKEPAV
jgi:hypothetical protein